MDQGGKKSRAFKVFWPNEKENNVNENENNLWRAAGEMTPLIRALSFLPESTGSIPSTYMATHNHV